ncbi:hypothetical protein PVAND_015152 [Polypedilum vanderplanki]|uniref:Chitin-binding type-2 domain-containing protein n=1 Tax=Polypedilum vanderplanki TaxID=319348 RepID=A0A9J6BC77_POLVA|nr:hypothetical protein PVAND_015152 [Polypedilum vanderplanki]
MLLKVSVFIIFAIFKSQAALDPCRGVVEGKNYVMNPRGCSWFFSCENRTDPQEGKCPHDLHFNVQSQSCSYPENVFPRCTLDDDLIANTPTKCPTNNDMRLVPHPFECSNYTLCWQRNWQNLKCPDDRPHFSIFDMDCNTEFLADCKAVDRFCGSVELEQFEANPQGCDDFVMCSECENNYKLHNFQCLPGFKFNKGNKTCLGENDFECHVKESLAFDLPPRPFTTDCSEVTTLRTHHPGDCQYYFYCTSTGSMLAKCGDGENFDYEDAECKVNGVCHPNINSTFEAEKIKIERKITNNIPRIDLN